MIGMDIKNENRADSLRCMFRSYPRNCGAGAGNPRENCHRLEKADPKNLSIKILMFRVFFPKFSPR